MNTLESAKMEYSTLVSKLDIFGDAARNEIINNLIDTCLDEIDALTRQAMPNPYKGVKYNEL